MTGGRDRRPGICSRCGRGDGAKTCAACRRAVCSGCSVGFGSGEDYACTDGCAEDVLAARRGSSGVAVPWRWWPAALRTAVAVVAALATAYAVLR